MSEHTPDQAVGSGRNHYYAGQFDAEEPADTAQRLRLVAERDSLRAVNAELLEALKTARDHIDMESLDVSHCNDAEKIRAAIAKARAVLHADDAGEQA